MVYDPQVMITHTIATVGIRFSQNYPLLLYKLIITVIEGAKLKILNSNFCSKLKTF